MLGSMAIDNQLLKILVCPETKLPVRLAPDALVDQLNIQVEAGTLMNKAGKAVVSRLDGGLLREDGSRLYPIIDEIPVMLVEESIELSAL